MPIFRCEKCGCVENTASSGYWLRKIDRATGEFTEPALCSECDPRFEKWHGMFDKMSATGYFLGNDGFLYSKETVESDYLDHRIKHQDFKIIGRLDDEGKVS